MFQSSGLVFMHVYSVLKHACTVSDYAVSFHYERLTFTRMKDLPARTDVDTNIAN